MRARGVAVKYQEDADAGASPVVSPTSSHVSLFLKREVQ